MSRGPLSCDPHSRYLKKRSRDLKLTEDTLVLKEHDLVHRALILHPPIQSMEADNDIVRSELQALEL